MPDVDAGGIDSELDTELPEALGDGVPEVDGMVPDVDAGGVDSDPDVALPEAFGD